MTDLQIVGRLLSELKVTADPQLLKSILDHLDIVTQQSIDSIGAVAQPGSQDVLVSLNSLGWTNGILTGNTPRRAQLKLDKAGMADLFNWDSSFFGERAVDRNAVAQEASIEAAKRGVSRTVTIGDTPRDVQAAKKAGIEVIAVATGQFSLQDLEASGPNLAVPDLVTGRVALLDYLR